MKRRGWATAVAATLVGATLSVGGPARAAEVDCSLTIFQQPPGFTVVVRNGLDVDIYPDRAGDDIDAWRDWVQRMVVNKILCLEGGRVTGAVSCASAKVDEIVASLDLNEPDLRYIHRDPTTGGIGFRGNLLVADATACLP